MEKITAKLLELEQRIAALENAEFVVISQERLDRWTLQLAEIEKTLDAGIAARAARNAREAARDAAKNG